MTRVLIAGFCSVPGPDRAGVQLGHVMRALARNHRVDVLVVKQDHQAYVERHRSGRVLRVPIQATRLRERVDAFRRALRRQLSGAEYDIVHFRDGWSGIPVLELRDKLRYAAVFDAARAPLADPQILDLEVSAELARDEEACVLGADLVLAPTEPARRYLGARGRPDRVFVCPPGVDVDLFDWEPAAAGPPLVLYVGALAPGRGVRILVRAMAQIADRSDARLALVGPMHPDFGRSLEASIERLGLAQRIKIIGPRDHQRMPSLIAAATVCVVPAAVELSPKPTALYPTRLLEFMACRRAVVAPRRGTLSLLMQDGVEGVLFTPGDPDDLAAKILSLLDDEPLREELARGGYKLVRRAHTAAATRRAIHTAYATLPHRADDPLGDEERVPTDVSTRPDVPLTEPFSLTELEDATEVAGSAAEDDPAAGQTDAPDISAAGPRWPSVTTEPSAPPVARASPWPETLESSSRAVPEPWVVDTSTHRAARDESHTPLDGTPVGVESSPIHRLPVGSEFVAGEIDVPTPPPELITDSHAPFTAVSVLLGSVEDDDEATGESESPPSVDA